MKREKVNQGRIQYVKKNLIWSAVSTICSTCLPLILRTLFVRFLGSEYLGLNSLCTSILYVLSAAEFGVSNAFVFRLYKPVAKGENTKVRHLLYFYRSVYQKIGIIIFVAGILLLPFLGKLIKDGYPIGINVYLVFLIYLLNTVVSYVFWAYPELVLIASQRRSYIDIIGCLALNVMYLGQIFFIVRKEYYGYLLIMPVITISANYIKYCILRKKYPEYDCEKGIEKEEQRIFFRDAFSVAVYKIRDISRNAFDSVVISAFVGLGALADYQNYYTVLIVPIILRQVFATAVSPSMGNCIALDDKGKALQAYKIFAYVYVYVSGWFAIIYGNLIRDFVILWLGEEFVLDNVFTGLFVIYLFVLGFSEQTKMVREVAGLWTRGRMYAGIEMITNIILNVILVLKFREKGVLLATIITILLINISFENYIVFHDFFRKGLREILMIYCKALVWFLGTGVVCGFLCNAISYNGIIGLFWKTVICGTVPAVTFGLSNFRTKELILLLREVGFLKEKTENHD